MQIRFLRSIQPNHCFKRFYCFRANNEELPTQAKVCINNSKRAVIRSRSEWHEFLFFVESMTILTLFILFILAGGHLWWRCTGCCTQLLLVSIWLGKRYHNPWSSIIAFYIKWQCHFKPAFLCLYTGKNWTRHAMEHVRAIGSFQAN